MSRLIIEAGKTGRHYGADLWRFRELFFFLSRRDMRVRYQQTVIGVPPYLDNEVMRCVPKVSQ